MKKIGTLIISIFVLTQVQGQTLQQYLEEGDISLYDHEDYYNAMRFYSKALEFEPNDSISICYRLAESARQFGSFAIAAENYEHVMRLDNNNSYPATPLYLAQTKAMMGNYNDAIANYDDYRTQNLGDRPAYDEMARAGKNAANWAMLQEPDDLVSIETLGPEINTDFEELAPVILDDGIVFSSTRTPMQCCNKAFPFASGKIYKTSMDGITGVLSEDIDIGDTTTSFITYNQDMTMAIYTICRNLSTSRLQCDLYSRSVNSDGSYGPAVILPPYINAEGFTTTHPNIGYHAASNGEVLFFSSDRPGGSDKEGDMDLWYSKIVDNGSFGAPVNISDLNTDNDEVTPNFHSKSQKLFFSAKGYDDEFGGYDIREAKLQRYVATDVRIRFRESENIGLPTNSSGDDLFYVESADSKSAWFSSNRNDANQIDTLYEACCFDIFEATLDSCVIMMDVQVTICECDRQLPNAEVLVIDVDSGEEIPAMNGKYKLTRGQRYVVTANHAGYSSGTLENFVANKADCNQSITESLCLDPEERQLAVSTWYCNDCDAGGNNTAINAASVQLLDLDTDEVIATQYTGTGNTATFTGLLPCKQYQVITTVNENCVHRSETIQVDPAIDPATIEKTICFQPPSDRIVSLYFENDYPKGRTGREVSTYPYTSLYYAYVNKNNMQTYRRNFSRGEIEDVRDVKRAQVTDFFDNTVIASYEEFKDFAEEIKQELLANPDRTVSLTVEGHASRKWEDEYNASLSNRRIDAARQDMTRMVGKELMTRINFDGVRGFGEGNNPDFVSDSQTDTKNSIYNPDAAQWRKVVIRRTISSCEGCNSNNQ